MVFSSLEFLFLYLPITLICYYLAPLKWRNAILFAVSLVFYGWGEPRYLFLMLFTIAVDYICGYLVGHWRGQARAKWTLVTAIVLNLAILGFFKYYNFFANNLRMIPALAGIPDLDLELPVGISFYTFQALSYVIDVYRGDASAQRNPVSFGAYVTLFPQLIAGPIVRYRDVDDQLREREHSVFMVSSGIRTFCAGFAKKVLLADVAGALWADFAAIPADSRTVLGAWMGILFYTAQIYLDFSAYSDMAIGLGKIVGFRFLENFNYPYIADSITDFWRRWHISLSTWFREYVYIPLGGNRVGRWKLLRNSLVVWLLTGFWHGASWNFVLWGLYYFVLQMLEKLFLGRWLEKLPMALRRLYTMFFVVIGWLLFTASDSFASSGEAWGYLGAMFGVGAAGFAGATDLYDLLRNLIYLAIVAITCTPTPRKLFYRAYAARPAVRTAAAVLCVLSLCAGTIYLVASGFSPFLYYRF
ncbi:MAG: MBOAT family protein [Clostridia bacterium]|nr:MBOAT family protein [Clostridia bacterium]